MKIYEQRRGNLKEGDLLAIGNLLMKAGYVVRLGREKKGSNYVHFIEYSSQDSASTE